MEFQGTVYQFTALPFRISTAPWLFTKIVRVVKTLFHLNGSSLFQYLNDWLGDALSQAEAHSRSDLLIKLCHHLGFLINFNKSELIPMEVFDFVGIHFNLHLGKAFITEKNLAKVLTKHMRQVQQASAASGNLSYVRCRFRQL